MIENDPLGKSHHVVIACNFYYQNVGFKSCFADRGCQKYNFKRGNYDHMSEEPVRVDWGVLEGMDVDESWDFIVKVLQEKH